MKFSPYGSPSL